MVNYLFKSNYRLAIAGLVLGLCSLWYFWLKTDQIISSALNLYTTGIVLLNTALGFFSYDRQKYVTKVLYFFSYVVVLMAAYTLYSLTKVIR